MINHSSTGRERLVSGRQAWRAVSLIPCPASGTTPPTVSTINFVPSDVLANGAIVPLATAMSSTEIAVFNGAGGSTNVILDVTGYFAP